MSIGNSQNNSRNNNNSYNHINNLSCESSNSKYSVLIASSNQEKLKSAVDVFRGTGFLVKTAANTVQLIKIVQQTISNQKAEEGKQNFLFEFVLIDLDMPISNGFDCCKKLRQVYDSSEKLPYLS